MTRAKKYCILVGQPKAINSACRTSNIRVKQTWLRGDLHQLYLNQYLLNKYENIFDSVFSNSEIISKCILAEREIVDTMQKMAKAQNEFTKCFGKLVENQDKMTNALRSVTEKVVKLEKE